MLHWTSLRFACGVTLAAFALALPAISQAQLSYSIIDLGIGTGTAINPSG